MPAADCLTPDPTRSGRPFKIINRVGRAGVVAAFHVGQTQTPAFCSVSPQDAGLTFGRYGWQEYFSGKQGVLQTGQTIPLSLADADQFRFYRFVPLENGRMGKRISMAAVLAFDAQGAALYESGEFGFWHETEVRVLQANRNFNRCAAETLCGWKCGRSRAGCVLYRYKRLAKRVALRVLRTESKRKRQFGAGDMPNRIQVQ